MKVYTAHIGPISPERQRCLDRQREVYGDDWSIDRGPWDMSSPEEARIASNMVRFMVIRKGGLVLDSDVYPNERWEPTESGLYVCHSWGRPDYWAICNNGANELVEEAIAYGENVLKEAGGAGPGTLLWPLRWIMANQERIKHIPMEAFNHLYLTTSTNGAKP